MAEFSLDDLAAMFDNGTDASEKFFKETKDGMLAANTAVTGLVSELQQASTTTTNFTDEVKKGLKTIYEMKTAAQVVIDFAKNIQFTNDELKIFGLNLAVVAGTLKSGIKPDAFNQVGASARDATSSLAHTGETLEKVANLFTIFPGGEKVKSLATATKVLGQLADPARQFEAGMLMAASASGELDDMLREIGDDMSGLERKMVSFTNLTYDIANASGLSTAQVGKYAAELNQIPGALSTTVDLTGKGSENMHLLDAAIKVATGTGQNFEAVFRQMNHVYLEFGTTGKGALEYVSRLSAASAGLKLPLDLVRTYTEGAAHSFRFFGDNSQAAINILARFGPALKESGLGPKAIADLTQNITQNISQMGLAQRAFLSQTSGGPGGLQGGYQIELLKQQGKIDEIQKMVETSLRRQFGGRIVTLQEGAQSQSAAAQLTKEVQLLTTGPTKIANTEGEAYKILEAMSKGTAAPQAQAIKGPQEALSSAVERGNTFQERNYNALTTLTNWAEKQAQFAAISANNLSRLVTGRENPLAKRAIEEIRTGASEQASTRKIVTGDKASAPVEQTLNESLLNSLNEVKGPQLFLSSINKGWDQLTAQQNVKNQQLAEVARQKTNNQNRRNAGVASPQARVENDIPRTNAGLANNQRFNVPANKEEATVKVMAVCSQCNAKMTEATVLKLVDGKFVKMQRDQINHAHGSY